MKRAALLIALAIASLGFGQGLPFETEADRRPILQTGGNCIIFAGTILTASNGTLKDQQILVRNGKIVAIGKNLPVTPELRVIDARDKVVMPGIIDGHSHRASDATNEGTDSITAEVRILDVLNSSGKNVWTALASGHTSALVLHGSANCVGGESIVVKYRYRRPLGELPIPDAPRQIKFALGENVTRSQGGTGTRFPRSRMGVEALYRRSFEEAREYNASWAAYEKARATDPNAKPPRRDLRLQTLGDILKGKVWVQCHSYRGDEMLMLARLGKEYGFKVGALQHGLEAYKIAPELAELGVGVSIFVDNWSFKVEGYDGIPYNAAICTKAGVNVSINTDGLSGTTALNIDAAKVMRYGGLTEQEAIRTITLNCAKQLGIDGRTGSVEVGKDADLAIWDGHPLSVYSRCAMTLIEGEVFFQRRDAFGIDKKGTLKTELDRANNRPLPATPRVGRIYAITGGTVFPVSGPAIVGGTVILRDGKIEAVGRNIPIPSGAIRVDARGLRVYPGFLDAGNSMGLSEISPVSETVDVRELGDYQPDMVAATAVQVQSEHIPVARNDGVLASLTRPSGGIISGQASVIEHFGYSTAELTLKRKAALTINFPSAGGAPQFNPDQLCCGLGDLRLLFGGEVPDDYLDALRFHDELKRKHSEEACNGEDHEKEIEEAMVGYLQQQEFRATGQVKQLADYFDRVKQYASDRAAGKGKRDLLLEAMVPYVNGEAPVLLRVRTAASIRTAIGFARQYKLKAILAGAADAWKEASLIAESGYPVILTPAGRSTLAANSPVSDWDPYDTPYLVPLLLKQAGVKFCFQSEDNSGSFNLPVRVGQHCAYGLSVDDAVRALTLDAAEILGVADRLGSLDKGKLGNLVITDGDPFELTSKVRYVFVEGRPAPLESRFTRLRDQYMRRLDPAERQMAPRRDL